MSTDLFAFYNKMARCVIEQTAVCAVYLGFSKAIVTPSSTVCKMEPRFLGGCMIKSVKKCLGHEGSG